MTATRQEAPRVPPDRPATVGGTIDLVKAYAEQETIGPLKGAARWLGMGVAGAVTLALGLGLLLLGLLRLLQTEWTRSATGALSWVAYAIVLIVCLALMALAISRINRDSLHKHPR